MSESKEPSHSKASVQNRSVAQNVNSGAFALPAVPVIAGEQQMPADAVQLKSFTGFENRSAVSPAAQFKSDGISAARQAASSVQAFKPLQRKTNDTGLPDNLKSGVESMSGYDMSDVKVHYNSPQPSQLQAHAYAQGTDIHVGPGQEKHLPHEAWHVVQQKQGRVKPTIQMKQGIPVNDDTGLEREADVMGEKAVAQGKSIDSNIVSQFKINTSPKLNHTAQRQVVQKTEEEFQKDNAPILSMISNASVALTSVNWAGLAAGSDGVGTATAVGGLVGSLTGVAGSATSAIQDTSKPDISKAAGDITSGIGSSLGSLVQSVIAVKKAYDAAKGKESVLVGTGEVAIAIMSALKSGAEAAVSIQKFIGGSMPPAVMQMIPGLGIAIAACEAIKNAYTGYNAYQMEAEMTGVSGHFKEELIVLLSGLPEVQVPTLFANEKRGKFGNRVTYSRLKPGLFESLAGITEKGITPEVKTARMEAFRAAHNLSRDINIEQLAPAIRTYELGSKMQEINQKRKIQGARAVFTSLLAVAGEIAKFFPADGGITAGVLLGASAGIGAAQSAGKFLQGVARDHAILGGDANRSSDSKHKEYVNHTRSIYEFLSAIPQPVTEASKGKVDRGESLIKATGANMATVYKTDYSLPASITSQVDHIVKSMKAGR